MKRHLLSILFIGLLAAACKKKHTETPVTEEPKDEITHYDFTPDKTIQSVRSFTSYYTVCTNIIPSPSDSTASYELDINSDQVADFRFTAVHNLYKGTEYCGHCYSWDYSVIVQALSPGDSIAVQTNHPGPKIFQESAIINQKNIWISSGPLLYQECTTSWDFSNGYIGVKVGKSFGYIHIKKAKNNGISLLDFGLNKTESRAITCGQN